MEIPKCIFFLIVPYFVLMFSLFSPLILKTNHNKTRRIWTPFVFYWKIAESHVTSKRPAQKKRFLSTPESWNVWNHAVPMGQISPYCCEFRKLITCKKTNSWGRPESTSDEEIWMGKRHEKLPPMELRVSKLLWSSHIFSIGIINMARASNVKNIISYHGPIWAVDLGSCMSIA
jgi:hypothetical protein